MTVKIPSDGAEKLTTAIEQAVEELSQFYKHSSLFKMRERNFLKRMCEKLEEKSKQKDRRPLTFEETISESRDALAPTIEALKLLSQKKRQTQVQQNNGNEEALVIEFVSEYSFCPIYVYVITS